MSRTVEVTQEDIDNGRRQDPESCPLALAVRRAFGTEWASVGDYIFTADGDCQCPPDARQFWLDFDRGLPVKPFSFEIELVGEGTW